MRPIDSDFNHFSVDMVYPPPAPPSLSAPIRVDGSELDVALSNSQLLTQTEILNRRSRRLTQLARIYRNHYWALMEELKLKHREYYWECGKSPTQDDTANLNGNLGGRPRCEIYGCKAKAMALTKFFRMHILSDSNQKLYKACSFSVKWLTELKTEMDTLTSELQLQDGAASTICKHGTYVHFVIRNY